MFLESNSFWSRRCTWWISFGSFLFIRLNSPEVSAAAFTVYHGRLLTRPASCYDRLDHRDFSLNSKRKMTEPWQSNSEQLLQADPQVLAKEDSSGTQPRLAKDVDYAKAVQDAWKSESKSFVPTKGHSVVYSCSVTGELLYGHMIGPKEVPTDQKQVPGVVLFHTGAGPQDLFLHWKANILSHELGGAKVLIADMISDKSGWAWGSDRSKFNTAKDGLLPESGIHDVLQNRVQAAVSLLSREIDVDPSRIAALGWCFGGHAIQELVLSQSSCPLKAMATFHGVFHPILPKASSPNLTKPSSQCNVVIYTGQDDPFVTPQTVSATATALESSLGGTNQVKVVEFKQVKHGFSNPAQNFNPNPAFCYNQQAATQSWDQTIVMLKSSLSL